MDRNTFEHEMRNLRSLAVEVENHDIGAEKILVIASNEESVVNQFRNVHLEDFPLAEVSYVAQPKMAEILYPICAEREHILPWRGKYTKEILGIIPESDRNLLDAFIFFEIQSFDLRDENIMEIASLLQKQNGTQVYGIDRENEWHRYIDCGRILATYEWYRRCTNELKQSDSSIL